MLSKLVAVGSMATLVLAQDMPWPGGSGMLYVTFPSLTNPYLSYKPIPLF